MRTKVLLIFAIAMMLLVLGCRTDKAGEKQQSAANQPAASPSPTSEAAAQPSPASGANAASPSPTAEPTVKTKTEASPPNRPEATPAAVASATPVPTPIPTPPPPIIIPAGTSIGIRTAGPISTSKSQPNQEFQASLARPLVVKNEIVVPVGAPVTGAIPESKAAGRIKGEGRLSLTLTSLTVKGKAYRLATEPVVVQAKGRGKRSAAMIGGGGGAGALIGGLAGGGKGAAIGGLAGAAAGTAGATMTGKRDVDIPAETIVTFRLSQPLVLPPRQGGPSTKEAPDLKNRTQEAPPLQVPAEPERGSQPASRPPK